MRDEFPDIAGGARVRPVATPQDAGAGGRFGGWNLSQMGIASSTFVPSRSGKPAVTVRVEDGHTAAKVQMKSRGRARAGEAPHKVPDGVFAGVARGRDGGPPAVGA